MNIALFGGTFDPIHRGHLAVARAAMRRFRLHEVHFVPAAAPPLRPPPRASFLDRYAMVALATAGESRFVPSLLEAPLNIHSGGAETRRKAEPNYSLDTVRRFKKGLRKGDQLFFLVGMDSFAGLARWHRPEALLRECEFIVVSRPGFQLEEAAAAALPPGAGPWGLQRRQGRILLRSGAVHLLSGVREPASATAVRRAAQAGRPLARWVGREVAAYIGKRRLYQK